MKNLAIICILSIPLHLFAQTTGKLTDKRDGRIYETVRIANQWWMAENLNFGTRILGSQNMSDNETAEKYCYDDNETNCTNYGALYQWSEMMKYSAKESSQGICPDGWHIPSDQEWKEMEMALGMSQEEADLLDDWRGTTEGIQLKSGGSSGFEALNTGFRSRVTGYEDIGSDAYFWTSTSEWVDYGYFRMLSSSLPNVSRSIYHQSDAMSLRCVKDDFPFDSIKYYDRFVKTVSLLGYNFDVGEWGDFNLDGYLDAIAGDCIYENKGDKTFSQFKTLYDLSMASATWFDYGKTGFLHLLIKENLSERGTLFHLNKNDYCNNEFVELNNSSIISNSLGYEEGSMGRIDFNNDGRSDLVLTGRIKNTSIINISLDRDLLIMDMKIDDLPLLFHSSIDCGDYNNDGYSDLLLTGTNEVSNRMTYIYKNTGHDQFERVNTSVLNIKDGNAKWGDYDNDGDLDILITGNNNDRITQIYRNDKNSIFSEVFAISWDYLYSYADWVDINGDGSLDIALSGRIDTTDIIIFYTNSFKDSFALANFAVILNDEGPKGLSSSYAFDWGDFDNDGDLDLLTKGGIYENVLNTVNLQPEPPSEQECNIIGNTAYLSWNPGNDNETPADGLSYNVAVSDGWNILGCNDRSYYKSNIVHPLSDLSNGKRFLCDHGNAGNNTFYILKELTPGTYYWKVQSVDNSFLASEFSVGDTIVIPEQFTPAGYFTGVYDEYRIICCDIASDETPEIIIGDNDSISLFSFNITNQRYESVNSNTDFDVSNCFSIHDWNDDGNLDILASGYDIDGLYYITVYENEGDLNFTRNDLLIDSLEGYVEFIDVDNDADLDLFFTGRTTDFNYLTILYFNENMRFNTSKILNIPGIVNAYITISDLDKDMDYDILISGINELEESVTKLYLNNNTDFMELNANFIQLNGQNGIWDFNNDGEIDIIITGADNFGNVYMYTYENLGNGLYNEIELYSYRDAYFSIGDFNSDGFEEILISGKKDQFSTMIISYEGNNEFSFQDYSYLYSDAKCTWFDYNQDHNLDIVLSFPSESNNIYTNSGNFFNTKPSIPDGLVSYTRLKDVNLRWNKSFDDDNPDSKLTYNLRIGSAPGEGDILFPKSNLKNSSIKAYEYGNVQNNLSWYLKDLNPGKYYWAVQAVDHSYLGSDWSEEQEFTTSSVNAKFSFDIVCLGDTTHLYDSSITSVSSIESWHWDFGDGTSSTDRNPEHQFLNSGVHDVMLKVTAGQDVDSIIKSVYVKHKPSPDFTANTVCEGYKTTFTNLSNIDSITVDKWTWEFGDGDISEVQGDIQHPYLAQGYYNTQLKIAATNGCSDSLTKEVIVGSLPNAKIGLDYGFPEICGGDSTRISVEYNKNYHYQWKTGGINLTKDTLDYLVIREKGNFSVDIINRMGNCQVTSEVVNITMLESPPVFTITASTDTNICLGEKVYLEVPHDPLYSYLWKYNGLILSDATSNSHDTKREGSYTVDVSFGTCKTTSQSKQIVYKPGLPQPKLLTFGSTAWYFVCDIENAITYRWYYNGNLVAESGNNIYWAGDRLGDYYVEINDGGECFVPSEKITIPVISTNISQLKKEHKLYLYPNPTSGTFQILYTDQYTGKVMVRISNIEGRVLKDIELYKNHVDFSEEMNLHGFKAGLYFLEFYTNQYSQKEKFVIMK